MHFYFVILAGSQFPYSVDFPIIRPDRHQVFNVKLSTDKHNVAICDMDVMDDGRHILCDFDNMKLKTFTPSMHFLSSLTFPSPPYSLAVLDEHEVVVSTGKYLHFVNVSTMLIYQDAVYDIWNYPMQW